MNENLATARVTQTIEKEWRAAVESGSAPPQPALFRFDIHIDRRRFASGTRIRNARGVVGEKVGIWSGASHPEWVYFVDDVPEANWAHPCRYVFVFDNDEIRTLPDKLPPNDDGPPLIPIPIF